MKRIIDVNFNRANEAFRVLEEIARFYINDETLSKELKLIRHKLSNLSEEYYKDLLDSRNTTEDIGTNIYNPSERKNILNIFKANIKRAQQALRVLAEYCPTQGIEITLIENTRYDTYTLEKKMYDILSSKLNSFRLKDKKLYLVTSSEHFKNDDDFLDAIASALKGGVQLVQLREKNHNAKRIITLGKKIRELTSIYNAIFIVNDRVDIAQIVDADGVHLGQDDIDINTARNILGDKMIIGISTHSEQQASKAIEQGADYIGVGPIFTTPTKPGREAVTLDYAKWASANVNIPWFAIGGINTENVEQVINAGATRIAVVRSIIDATTPQKAAEVFASKL